MENLDNKNPGDINGRTPLHEAASQGHFNTCKYIVGKINDKMLKTLDGKTPGDVALENGHVELGAYLNSFTNKGL